VSAKGIAHFQPAFETSMGDAALVNKTAALGAKDREHRKVRATVVLKLTRASLQTAVFDQVAPEAKNLHRWSEGLPFATKGIHS